MSERNGQIEPVDEALLETFLDGRLPPDQKIDVERRISAQPELQRLVSLQQLIDASIRRRFTPPPTTASVPSRSAASSLPATLPPSPAPSIPIIRWMRLVATAAIIGVSLGAAIVFWVGENPFAKRRRAYRTVPMAEVYAAKVADGFKPDWVCESDEQFRAEFCNRLGYEISLAHQPSGVETLGMTYAGVFSARTMGVVANVHGKPVMLFVDYLSNDTNPSPPTDSSLHLYRREAPSLVYYELSPHDEAHVMPLLSEPVKPAPTGCGRSGEAREAEATH